MDSASQRERWQTSSARLAKGGGSKNIIGLNTIRREAGPRWEKMRDGITTRLEQLLRQRLGPSDFFVPIDETSYLVVMPSAAPEDARTCCLRISYDLHTSLLGSCSIEHLELGHAEAVADDVLELRPLPRAELLALAKKADLQLAAPRRGDAIAQPQLSIPQPPPPPSYRLEIGFVPVWDAQYEVIRAYRCIPKKIQFRPGLELPPRGREISRNMLEAMQKVIDISQAHLARGERFLLNIPVPFELLCSPIARMDFVSSCRRLPCELRPFLGFKVESVPAGVPHSRLVDLASSVSSFGSMVLVKLRGRVHALDTYRGVGIKALGVDLRKIPVEEQSGEIARLATETKRIGISAFLDDVASEGTLRLALEAGIQWMSGPVVASALKEPGPLRRLPAKDLLNDIVAL